MIKPRALKPGARVAIVSLSSGVLGEAFAAHQRQLGVLRLAAFGLEAVFMQNALRGMETLAAHPELRAADLKQAFMDPTIQGVFAAIGGDDTYRLVPYLLDDPAFGRQVRQTPKLFSGFSDATINHLLFYHLGLMTYYGPNFLNDWAELGPTLLPDTAHTLRQYLANPQTTTINSSPIWYEERTDFSPRQLGVPRVSHHERRGHVVLRGRGTIEGPLLGGNLETLAMALAPNLRHPDAPAVMAQYHLVPPATEWAGRLLFLETSEEKPSPAVFAQYLATLVQAGILGQVAAVIMGKPQDETYFDAYNEVLLATTAPFNLPVMVNLNFGHAYPRAALPYGAQARLGLTHKTLTITEPYFAD